MLTTATLPNTVGAFKELFKLQGFHNLGFFRRIVECQWKVFVGMRFFTMISPTPNPTPNPPPCVHVFSLVGVCLLRWFVWLVLFLVFTRGASIQSPSGEAPPG